MNFLIPVAKLQRHEKCWILEERDELTPDGKSVRRIQSVRVWRDGRLIQFDRDLGPASAFAGVGPVGIVSLGEDEVGRVIDMAEDARRADMKAGLAQAMQDHLAAFNVVDAAVLQAEQVQRYLRQNPRTSDRIRKGK